MPEDTQTGYRVGMGTIDAIYVVKTVVEEETKKREVKCLYFLLA